ncbi:MAG TPA: hypothetical protein VNA27_07785 [Rubrobacteraceae bacterium]|nr:hypothetical protein [Rubrobacteraceae bacterium]
MLERRLWEVISAILKDPEQLRADLERMIELEREGMRGDPERGAKVWLDKLAEMDRKRSGFQDMAAEGLITFDELRTKLAALDETRATAERELEVLKSSQEHLESLKRDKESLLEAYAALTPEALSSLGSEERYKLYKMLKLRAVIRIDGTLDIRGTFVEAHEVSECEVSSSWSLWAPAASCATLLQKRS